MKTETEYKQVLINKCLASIEQAKQEITDAVNAPKNNRNAIVFFAKARLNLSKGTLAKLTA